MSEAGKKTVLIIGGGASGMSAAYGASKEGTARVILLEKKESIGKKLSVKRSFDPKRATMMIYLGNGADPKSFALAKRCKTSRAFGCASLEMAYVATGEADGFMMNAENYQRAIRIVDIAASALILREAGGEKALADIARIRDYIRDALMNPPAAEHIVSRILEAGDGLAEKPRPGAPFRSNLDLLKYYRYLPVENYILVFRVQNDTAKIVRVLHRLQDAVSILLVNCKSGESIF